MSNILSFNIKRFNFLFLTYANYKIFTVIFWVALAALIFFLKQNILVLISEAYFKNIYSSNQKLKLGSQFWRFQISLSEKYYLKPEKIYIALQKNYSLIYTNNAVFKCHTSEDIFESFMWKHQLDNLFII